MKKGLLKKVLSLSLAGGMVLSLAACGKGQGGGGGNSTELAKQNVFSYQDVPVELDGENTEVRDMMMLNDRVYTVLNSYSWSETGNTNTTEILSFKTDGTDSQAVKLESSPVNAGEGVMVNSWINTMTLGNDGSIYAVNEDSWEDSTDPENIIYQSTSSLICWNGDGTIKWNLSMDELKGEQEYFYVNRLFAQDDGTVVMMTGEEKPRFITVGSDGKVQGEKPVSSTIAEMNGAFYEMADGSMILVTYNTEGTKMYASTYDPKTDTEGEKKELPGNWNMFNSVNPGVATDFVLTNNMGVYSFNIGDAEPKMIMNFVNSDLSANYLQNIVMIDDKHFAAAYSSGDDYQTKVALFTSVDPKDIPDKAVIMIGWNYVDSAVRQRVVDFNKTSDKYRITVRDYSNYNTMEDYNAGYKQFNNDIISGNIPDILMTDNTMPLGNYIAKGLFADVGSMIEKDEELSQVEFMENAFKAYSVNDKLYAVVPTFNVATVIGKTSVVGDREGWTMEEMQQLLSSMPEGTQSFGDITRSYFFNMLMQFCGNDFVDQATGKCNFNSQEFINVLEFAKSLPEDVNREEGGEMMWRDYESQYRDNKTVLMSTSIYDIRNMNYVINGTFGEEVSFVGFPSENKKGSVINSNLSFAISAKSKNQEGAWEFVRYYLTDEYQNSDKNWGLPVQKKAFMDRAEQALSRPFYMDDTGKKIEYDDSIYINDEEVVLPPMSRELMEEIVAFVESVDKTSYYNQDIQNIIDEETAAFFAGQKSASDVAGIIQSRAQIYVNESR